MSANRLGKRIRTKIDRLAEDARNGDQNAISEIKNLGGAHADYADTLARKNAVFGKQTEKTLITLVCGKDLLAAQGLRLEVTHRRALYKTGFEDLYRSTFKTKNCLEETLATANGYLVVAEKCFGKGSAKNKAALLSCQDCISKMPAGYREAVNYLTPSKLSRGELMLAEEYHQHALPDLPTKDPTVWSSHKYSFRGIGQVNSRISYAIHQSDPIFKRIRSRPYSLTYREVASVWRSRSLESKAQETFYERWPG